MRRLLFCFLVLMFSLFTAAARSQTASGAGNCPAPVMPARPVVDEPPRPGQIHITAGEQGAMQEGGISTLSGNVEITLDQHQMRADRVTVDQAGATANVQGDIHYWNNELYLHGDTARMDFDTESGVFTDAGYHILETRGHGRADQLTVVAGRYSEATDIDYTTCNPQAEAGGAASPPWQLSATRLRLDHQTDRGVARNVVLRVKDIPVLYTPYLSFPLTDRRETGFLMPLAGSSNRNGVEIQTPWYWNIAPNMDATLTPRLLTDSGLMLMGEFRYLFKNGSGTVNGEFLPADSEYHDRNRSFISLEHQQSLTDRAGLYVLFNNVSDKHYFEDFGQTQYYTSNQFLERRAEASWRADNWSLTARVHDYQMIDAGLPATARPYRKLPQFHFSARSPTRNRGLNYRLTSELIYFERGDNPLLENVDGFRFDLAPSVSWPVHARGGFMKPELGIRYTRYALDDQGRYEQSADRLLPHASLDSGLFFERRLQLGGEPYTQTLEPRLYYLYRPREDQSDIPVFDTGIDNFSFNYLFHGDRFLGGDRVGDANRLSLSVTSRFLDARGVEAAQLRIGQSFYFHDREVVLTGQPIQTDRLSPLVAGFTTSLFGNLHLEGELEWDPNEEVTQKLVLEASYRPASGRVLNAGYRVRRAVPGIVRNKLLDIEQVSISTRWPLAGDWNMVGSWIYALEQDKSLDIFAGVEYNGCCWGVRLVGRRFLSSLDGDYQNGIFLQFVLKGLAGTGRKTVEFLSENIPGYRSEF